MKLATIQMVSGSQWPDNREQARALLAQAAQGGAELAVLPEYFCLLGRRETDKLDLAEAPGDGPIQRFLSDSAREFGLWLVGGTLPLTSADPARATNTSLVYGPDGQRVARYDKLHLFRLQGEHEQHDEARTLVAGTAPAMFELPSRDGHRWRIGLSVCYDLRFPELYRHYAAQGAELLLVPSAFTWHTGQAHWELLLRARAVENLAYVAAAAQGGRHDNGRRTWGHTLVAEPWGDLLGQLDEGPGVLLADIGIERLESCRAQLPAWRHRVL